MSTPLPEPRFARVLRGYDRAEVDKVVERIRRSAEAPGAPGAITPDEIESAMFRIVMRGYDEHQVDDYLDHAVTHIKRATATQTAGDGTAVPRTRSVRARGQRFAIAYTGAYKTEDVDAFVDRVESTLNTTLTSFEVQSLRLRNGLRGYSAGEVDEWLNQVQAFLISRGR